MAIKEMPIDPLKNFVKLTRLIQRGILDDYLDDIITAVSDRRVQVRREKLTTFEVGDRIRITQCKPRYLQGYVGTITHINPSNEKHPITVDLDVPFVRRYSGTGLRLNAGMIEKEHE